MSKDEPIGFQILRAIRRIIRKTSEHSRHVGRQAGVSVPQMLCLRAIAEADPGQEITVASVAETVQLSAPTVSRILDRLEKGGYLKRERSSVDRRKVFVALTEQGIHRLESLPQPLHEQFLARLESLEENERIELRRALERIVELMDACDIDAAPVLTPELEVGIVAENN
ncbi:MarR family winged helix-turn-helix transcriptional regulator [Rhodopirellula sp. MGV]|uniref:MarR family winged helix-turn-helix transcriptional regulator n=1 Tax=Rhodopirellula sp. MGV TaxID=2023130 RepID=UPI0018E9A8BF|nr:MarR family transcriptional regulator [Rhodopirellula sp. MGV]